MTTYTATAATLNQVLASEKFSSIAKAKAWARKQSAEVVISDDEMPSRLIKRVTVAGKSRWFGSAPESWFAA